MARSLTLSVLDQSVSVEGSTEDAAIRDTLELAVHCDRLGYALQKILVLCCLAAADGLRLVVKVARRVIRSND